MQISLNIKSENYQKEACQRNPYPNSEKYQESLILFQINPLTAENKQV